MGESERNLASAAAGWSARHRRRAILSWLAFVVIAYALGAATGVVQLTDVQQGNCGCAADVDVGSGHRCDGAGDDRAPQRDQRPLGGVVDAVARQGQRHDGHSAV